MKALLSLLLLGMFVTGCSGTVIDATVTSATRPVEGIEVSMDCPQVLSGSGRSLFGRTDATGHFVIREPAGGRWIHDGCNIVVGTRRFPVELVCTDYSADHCIRAVVKTDLGSEAADAPAPAP